MLGTATGPHLAALCRERFLLSLVWGMWVGVKRVAMATDPPEFLGLALDFSLLFSLLLSPVMVLPSVLTGASLALER